jgi:hypothetical protein
MRTMSITIDERLYRVLKKTAGPRGMSQFIAQALQEKLRLSRETLRREYRAAEEDEGRKEELSDWDAVGTESWR